MLRIDKKTTPIRNPREGVWDLYSERGEFVSSHKNRDEAVDASHAIELQKIKRIKELEQLYSRFPGVSLYGVG